MKSSDPRFEIRKGRPGTGLGLFTLVALKKGEFVLEYTGRKIPTPVADEMTTRYLFEIDEKWTIDGEGEENTARYINHFCEPNVEAIIEDNHINIYTTKKIAAGEELGIDYGDEYYDEFIKPHCKCPAKKHH